MVRATGVTRTPSILTGATGTPWRGRMNRDGPIARSGSSTLMYSGHGSIRGSAHSAAAECADSTRPSGLRALSTVAKVSARCRWSSFNDDQTSVGTQIPRRTRCQSSRDGSIPSRRRSAPARSNDASNARSGSLIMGRFQHRRRHHLDVYPQWLFLGAVVDTPAPGRGTKIRTSGAREEVILPTIGAAADTCAMSPPPAGTPRLGRDGGAGVRRGRGQAREARISWIWRPWAMPLASKPAVGRQEGRSPTTTFHPPCSSSAASVCAA